MSEPKRQPKADGEMNWEEYHSMAEIHAWLIRLQQTFPQYLTIEDIGYSYEGRPLKLIKLSKQPVLEIKLLWDLLALSKPFHRGIEQSLWKVLFMRASGSLEQLSPTS